MKATVIAPANLAFIKYWGKRDEKLRLPMNNSISMNLSECFTKTTVEFDKKLKDDIVTIDDKDATEKEKARVSKFLDEVRKLAKVKTRARVDSQNSFPKGTGIASSASAFAALALAATHAAGLKLSKKELSILARLGSGSACRSIPDGFAEWKKGTSHKTSYAVQLAAPDHWDLRNIVAILSKEEKEISSSEGHELAKTSPFFKKRLRLLPKRIKSLREALLKKDFSNLGKLLEEEAIELHIITMTSNPPIFYLTPKTWEIITTIQKWRKEGLQAYFTLDAGPNVHVICEGNQEKEILQRFDIIKGIQRIIVNKPAAGAHLA